MRFFFADSQDMVDPSFDFETETRSEWRVRQRDDVYPHEVFSRPPYDGVMISKAIVEGAGDTSGRYTMAQQHRLRRVGMRKFFRIDDLPIETMGDCGAFSYVAEEYPPVTVEEVASFYEDCGFDYGMSVDHVILGYDAGLDQSSEGEDTVPSDWRARQKITLELAEQFLATARSQDCGFMPIGIAQGWSPNSYAHAVRHLQQMGYSYIALGGMVPLKTNEILETLEGVSEIRLPGTRLHLLGITRPTSIERFQQYGVHSIDSTSPLKQAFMDSRNNYYCGNGAYMAVRVPQADGNPKLQSRIRSGELDQRIVQQAEERCLRLLRGYGRHDVSLADTMDGVLAYERVHSKGPSRSAAYGSILGERPWESCKCEVCSAIGIQVVIFRGAERNKRRGFHNLHVFHERLMAMQNEDAI